MTVPYATATIMPMAAKFRKLTPLEMLASAMIYCSDKVAWTCGGSVVPCHTLSDAVCIKLDKSRSPYLAARWVVGIATAIRLKLIISPDAGISRNVWKPYMYDCMNNDLSLCLTSI